MIGEEWIRAEEAELAASIERNARIHRLAVENGFFSPTFPKEGLEGLWWEVPREFVPIAGCMMARVA